MTQPFSLCPCARPLVLCLLGSQQRTQLPRPGALGHQQWGTRDSLDLLWFLGPSKETGSVHLRPSSASQLSVSRELCLCGCWEMPGL